MSKYIKKGEEKEFWEILYLIFLLRNNNDEVEDTLLDELLTHVDFENQYNRSRKQFSELFRVEKKDKISHIDFCVNQIVSKARILYKHHTKDEFIQKLTAVYQRYYAVDKKSHNSKIWFFILLFIVWIGGLFSGKKKNINATKEKASRKDLEIDASNTRDLIHSNEGAHRSDQFVSENESTNKADANDTSSIVLKMMQSQNHSDKLLPDTEQMANKRVEKSSYEFNFLEIAEECSTVNDEIRSIYAEVEKGFKGENQNVLHLITGHICYTLGLIDGYEPIGKSVYLPLENEALRLKVRDSVRVRRKKRGTRK